MDSNLTVGVRVIDGRINVKCAYDKDLVNLFKAIGQGEYDRKTSSWSYPATPTKASRVLQRICWNAPNFSVDRTFAELLDSACLPDANSVLDEDLPTVPMEVYPSYIHQRRGYHMIETMDACGLWDDMGTGKTKQVVDYVCNHVDTCKRVLILCPKSVCHVWRSEFEKHGTTPARVVVLDKGTVAKRAERLQTEIDLIHARGENIPLVVVMNYQSVIREPMGPTRKGKAITKPGLLASIDWDLMVCDECHCIKSWSGVTSRTAAIIGRKATKRVGLSGTPMPHAPDDAMGIYRWLDPSILPQSMIAFRKHYAVMGGFEGREVIKWINQDELNEKIYSIARRVMKRDVLDLPPVVHETLMVEMTPHERRVHRELEKDMVAYLDGRSEPVTATNTLVKLLRLQQCTSGFIGTDDDGNVTQIGSSKENTVCESIEGIDLSEPVVVFCKFLYDLAAVENIAAKLGRPYMELSGQQNDVGAKLAFDGPVAPLVGVQIQAGGVGVDMTASAFCYLYSTGYSMGDYDQALARLDRQGQTRPVTYVHAVGDCPGSIDQRVMEALDSKRDIIEHLLATFK